MTIFWRTMSGEKAGFKIQDSRFQIQDSRFKIQDSRFKIQDSRFKIQDSRDKLRDVGKQAFGILNFEFSGRLFATRPIGIDWYSLPPAVKKKTSKLKTCEIMRSHHALRAIRRPSSLEYRDRIGRRSLCAYIQTSVPVASHSTRSDRASCSLRVEQHRRRI